MRFGRRAKAAPRPATSGIAAFWTWWDEASDRVDAVLRAGGAADLVEELSTRVGAVHPGLAWELAPGRTTAHLLVVTAAGDPGLRAVARRWLRAAPRPSATWGYGDARPPVADLTGTRLTLDGHEVPLSDVVIATTRVGSRYDVLVHHDAMREMSSQAAGQLAFLALDSALGEVAVETWLGRIEPSPEVPLGGAPLGALPHLVDDLEDEHLDADGEPTWGMLEGQGPDGPVLAMAQVPLRAAYAPHLDHHVAVSVGFAERSSAGFPGPASLDALRRLEDHLDDRLGGAGRLVAHETSGGTRVLHYYVDSATPASDVIRAAVGGWREGRVRITDTHDPAWHDVAHLRT